ncbi:hypothetical protein HaLaN_08900 [Haematococcus lacustris]|uniref:Uncharacterized protein n=1 Tax=Haematococcus lacustris TaxID=44745 RepID=A0A699YTE3_HAELA|nr:hypothetical protein HaLaN_08900 [Haematococcus lacustris]
MAQKKRKSTAKQKQGRQRNRKLLVRLKETNDRVGGMDGRRRGARSLKSQMAPCCGAARSQEVKHDHGALPAAG